MSVELRPLKDNFEREVRTATRQAGRKALRTITKERQKSLGKVTSRRKKRVKGGVSKDGEAIIVRDSAPLARAQDEGLTITPKRKKYLRIPSQKPQRAKRMRFIRRDTKGGLHEFEKQEDRTIRLIATLKKKVTIKRLTKGLLRLAEDAFPEYLKDIERNLTK